MQAKASAETSQSLIVMRRADATAPVFEFNDKWLQIKGVNMTFVCGARAILSLARCQFQDYSQHVEYIRDLG